MDCGKNLRPHRGRVYISVMSKTEDTQEKLANLTRPKQEDVLGRDTFVPLAETPEEKEAIRELSRPKRR
jgi:hypothetical protein